MERLILEIRIRVTGQAVAQLAPGEQLAAIGRIARLTGERLLDNAVPDLHVAGRYICSGSARDGGKDSPGYQRHDAVHDDPPKIVSANFQQESCTNLLFVSKNLAGFSFAIQH
jgi:hypothetical protein